MVSQRTFIGHDVAHGHFVSGGAESAGVNVSEAERLLSVAGGGLLTVLGIREGTLLGVGMAAFGGVLVHRGLTGHCALYSHVGISTTEDAGRAASVAAGHGFKVVESVIVQQSADFLYRIWRDFESLPRFMGHLVKVETAGRRSHWVARGPAGSHVEWDAEIINEDPGRMIAWRSLEGSTVSTAGSVHFTPLSGDRGTQVVVSLKYDPPGGKLGGWIAARFGEEPSQQIRADLYRFKQLVETGALAESQARRF